MFECLFDYDLRNFIEPCFGILSDDEDAFWREHSTIMPDIIDNLVMETPFLEYIRRFPSK